MTEETWGNSWKLKDWEGNGGLEEQGEDGSELGEHCDDISGWQSISFKRSNESPVVSSCRSASSSSLCLADFQKGTKLL